MHVELTYFMSMVLRIYSPNLWSVCMFMCNNYPYSVDIQLAHEFPVYTALVSRGRFSRYNAVPLGQCSHYVIIATGLDDVSCKLPIRQIPDQMDDRNPILPFAMIIVTDDLEYAKYAISVDTYYGYGQDILIVQVVHGVDEYFLFRKAVSSDSKTDRNTTIVLLDIWNVFNHKFKYNNNLFPLRTNGLGSTREFYKLLTTRESSRGGELYVGDNSIHNIIDKEFHHYHNYSHLVRMVTLKEDGSLTEVKGEVNTHNHSKEGLGEMEKEEDVFITARSVANRQIFMEELRLVWIVPKPRIDPNMRFNFVNVFELRIWLLTILAFILTRLVFAIRDWVYGKLNERMNYEPPVTTLDIFGLFWSQPFYRSVNSVTSRIIHFSALIMLFYFVAMYSSGILSALVTPNYIKNYDNITHVMADPEYIHIYKEQENRIIRLNDYRALYSADKQYVFTAKVGFYNDKYIRNLGMNRSMYMVFSHIQENIPMYYQIITFPFSYDVKKNFILRAQAAGLMQQWLHLLLFENLNKYTYLDYGFEPDLNHNARLKFIHVLPILYVLAFGLILAAILFLIEVVSVACLSHSYFAF